MQQFELQLAAVRVLQVLVVLATTSAVAVQPTVLNTMVHQGLTLGMRLELRNVQVVCMVYTAVFPPMMMNQELKPPTMASNEKPASRPMTMVRAVPTVLNTMVHQGLILGRRLELRYARAVCVVDMVVKRLMMNLV